MRLKYTKDILTNAAANALSTSDVLRSLGLHVTGSMHRHIRRRLDYYKIDTSHFLGPRHSLGKVSPRRKKWQEVLRVKHKHESRTAIAQLRRAMIESGIPHLCHDCHCAPEWNGRKLVLQADHINGNPRDNRRENLVFRCPNCHSQTSTFCNKKRTNNTPAA